MIYFFLSIFLKYAHSKVELKANQMNLFLFRIRELKTAMNTVVLIYTQCIFSIFVIDITLNF